MRSARWSGRVRWIVVLAIFLSFYSRAAWGYYFDDRREMSLSGFAYSRAIIATQDGIASQKDTYSAGNLVSHRNFLTLEWRHKLDRVARDFPTLGPLFGFLNLNAFDYYLNLRTEYDGVYDYGPMKIRGLMRGERRHLPYFDDPRTATPFDGTYFTPGAAPDFPANTLSLSNRRWLRELRGANVRLFEWYFNITKGPLFLRIGRQNLSWGETDAFRLLDQINPLDNSFGGFLTSLDERRIPLNMLRAQWNFGTVGPIQELVLEGFYSIDNETNVGSSAPVSSAYFWSGVGQGNTPLLYGRTPCGGDFMAQRGLPAYFEDPQFPYRGSGPGPKHGGGCSTRAYHPHSSIEDGRGGVRVLGTIADFTWSIAHYYTYQDIPVSRSVVISPTRDHLRWDLGLATDSQGRPWPRGNPWGPGDPVAERMISSGLNSTGRGGIASVAGSERNIRSSLEFQRIQVTGGSLAFPVSALASLLGVGQDSPLFYLYTTIRGEVAYFRDYPTMRAYAHGDANTAFDRFLGGSLGVAGGAFQPGGALARQAGRRTVAIAKRDWLLWNIGVDHNQWIRWLNPYNTFTMSAQLFWTNRNGQDTQFTKGQPFSVLNDKDVIGARKRELQKPVTNAALAAACAPGSGSRAGCSLFDFGGQDLLTTFVVSTPYWGGDLRPSLTFFYDWSGSWLMQPGVDWTFWDPLRLSMRYSWIEGRGNAGIGAQNTKDNVWLELQYVLY